MWVLIAPSGSRAVPSLDLMTLSSLMLQLLQSLVDWGCLDVESCVWILFVVRGVLTVAAVHCTEICTGPFSPTLKPPPKCDKDDPLLWGTSAKQQFLLLKIPKDQKCGREEVVLHLHSSLFKIKHGFHTEIVSLTVQSGEFKVKLIIT